MDTVVYYRDSDGIVVGSTRAPNPVNIQAELNAWGAGISALRVADDSIQKGKLRRVVNGRLVHEDDISTNNRIAARKAALDLLQASAGLTDEQMRLVFGG